MNILTFDIEDWYNCDFISPDYNWDKYEVRIYEGVDRILQELSKRNLKATFFCLGWIAEKHPAVVQKIHMNGHQVGCHSYQHQLLTEFDRESFKQDTRKSKDLIENVIGESINAYRAPGFSISAKNSWVFEVLSELDFQFDCSIFPASHDYGGFLNYGDSEPALLALSNGLRIKEFPVNVKSILWRKIVYSGGGFFRFFPYWLIKDWAEQAPYLMTYFHPRDFDPGQPTIKSLPIMRKYKSYVGLSSAFGKFQELLNDFEFINVVDADKCIDWKRVRLLSL
jgi:peptidoglycan-N-acetylglucosamine deacetylase